MEMLPEWLAGLDDEDAAFIRRFILASGSLKEMARLYGVSYPTVRLRRDRLIHRLMKLEGIPETELVRSAYTFKRYREEIEPCVSWSPASIT